MIFFEKNFSQAYILITLIAVIISWVNWIRSSDFSLASFLFLNITKAMYAKNNTKMICHYYQAELQFEWFYNISFFYFFLSPCWRFWEKSILSPINKWTFSPLDWEVWIMNWVSIDNWLVDTISLFFAEIIRNVGVLLKKSVCTHFGQASQSKLSLDQQHQIFQSSKTAYK